MNPPIQHELWTRRRGGLTLVECLLASVILATVAAATLVATAASLQQQQHAQEQQVAVDLAEQLLEDVAARRFEEHAAEAGESGGGGGGGLFAGALGGALGRVGGTLGGTLDSVVDGLLPDAAAEFDGYEDRVDAGGRSVAGDSLAGYARRISVGPADADPDSPLAALWRVDIEVTSPAGRRFTVTRLVAGD